MVTRVIRAAAPTPLPQAPDVVLGVLNLHGEVIPVINLRKRFRLRERAVGCDDQFIIARTGTLTLGLAVDATEGVVEPSTGILDPAWIVSKTEQLAGVLRTAEGVVLIHDLEALLFPAEEAQIARALEQVQA